MSDQPIKPDPDRKPKRPADANKRAKMIVDLATGQAEDTGVDESRVDAGSAGGKARAKNLSDEQKSEIARKAAEARWKSA